MDSFSLQQWFGMRNLKLMFYFVYPEITIEHHDPTVKYSIQFKLNSKSIYARYFIKFRVHIYKHGYVRT